MAAQSFPRSSSGKIQSINSKMCRCYQGNGTKEQADRYGNAVRLLPRMLLQRWISQKNRNFIAD